MSNILDEIIQHKAIEISRRRHEHPLGEVEAACKLAPPPRGFLSELEKRVTAGEPAVIAECKKASPSKGLIREDYDPASIAVSYECGGATCLSVLTDERYFQGTDQHLTLARENCTLPVIRKDFTIDIYQLFEARVLGADCILLIVSCLDDAALREFSGIATELGMDVLIEVHDRNELLRALQLETPLIGINNRDLKRFSTDIKTTVELLNDIPNDRVIVTESGISSREDVEFIQDHGVNAFLVGEIFMRSIDPGRKLRDLFFAT